MPAPTDQGEHFRCMDCGAEIDPYRDDFISTTTCLPCVERLTDEDPTFRRAVTDGFARLVARTKGAA